MPLSLVTRAGLSRRGRKELCHSPSSRFMRTSWPASVLLFTRQMSVPAIQGIPCPVIPRRLIMERAPPQEEALLAHTPSRLDMQMSMASRELKAIPLKEGLSCMQSSSGSCCDCLRSLGLLFWALAAPAWPLCFLPWLLLSWVPFRGWFRERNSALFRTLFLSRALDRGWDAGIAVSRERNLLYKHRDGEKSLFSLRKASPTPTLTSWGFGKLQRFPSVAVAPSTDCSC